MTFRQTKLRQRVARDKRQRLMERYPFCPKQIALLKIRRIHGALRD